MSLIKAAVTVQFLTYPIAAGAMWHAGLYRLAAAQMLLAVVTALVYF